MVTKKKRIEILENKVAALERQAAEFTKRKSAEDGQPKGKSAKEILREYLFGEQPK